MPISIDIFFLIYLICSLHITFSTKRSVQCRGISWFVANPFMFNVFLLGKNDVGYIPRTSSRPLYILPNRDISKTLIINLSLNVKGNHMYLVKKYV